MKCNRVFAPGVKDVGIACRGCYAVVTLIAFAHIGIRLRPVNACIDCSPMLKTKALAHVSELGKRVSFKLNFERTASGFRFNNNYS